jgi:peptidoglycan/LPS O-acetylase OafA/YrhL
VTPSASERSSTPVERARADRDRLHAIDGLRFLAALGVVVYHFTALWSTVWGGPPEERFPTLGAVTIYFSLAPELFFVVSGFVVLWTAWGRRPSQVLASRLARVYPAYWACLALTSLLLLVVWPQGKEISPTEVAVNATLLQEAVGVRHVDGVYWTLWAELRFYLLITVLVLVGITRRRVLAFATLWPVTAVVVDLLGWDVAATVLVSRYAPFFAGGMALYVLHRAQHDDGPPDDRGAVDGRRATRTAWLVVGGNAVVAVATNLGVKAGEVSYATAFDPQPLILGALLVGCFAAVAAASLTRLRWLDLPVLTTLGALTYPLYLIHQFWGWWVIDQLEDVLPTWLTLAVAIAVALLLAVVVHRVVERRANRPLRRWLERVLRPVDRLARGSGRVAAEAGAAPRTGAPRQAGAPPTGPGGSEPSRMSSQNWGVVSGSSRTVEPTSPGR